MAGIVASYLVRMPSGYQSWMLQWLLGDLRRVVQYILRSRGEISICKNYGHAPIHDEARHSLGRGQR